PPTVPPPLAAEPTGLSPGRHAGTCRKPAPSEPGQDPVEVSLTLGWGSTPRIDTFPETRADPQCDADHGYGGSLLSEDLTLRVSAQAEGPEAVARAQTFALDLRRASFRAVHGSR